MPTTPRFLCCFCAALLPTWFLVPRPGRPDGAMLLHHLGRQHPVQVGHYLAQMQTTSDIATVALQGFEVVGEANVRGQHGIRVLLLFPALMRLQANRRGLLAEILRCRTAAGWA